MKSMAALGIFLFSLTSFAEVFNVKDAECDSFGYYRNKVCILIIENENNSAGAVFNSKSILTKFGSSKDIIGKHIEMNLSELLLLSTEEEESIRGFINYPEMSYYSALDRKIELID
ncbi:MAG: hypothetical protein AB7I27_12440 [Bacteriovoracaceae bacterium]